MAVPSAIIVHAFVTDDYSIKYVQRYSDTAQPLFYKITSYWGGLDGSMHVLGARCWRCSAASPSTSTASGTAS